MIPLKKILFEKIEKRVGAGIIFFSLETQRFLIVLRSPKVNKGNTWSGVGGKVEKDETPSKGAIREAEEEIEFSGKVILRPIHIFIKNHRDPDTKKDVEFRYHNYIGIVNHEFEPTLNWENVDSKWVTLEELINMPDKHPGIKELLNKKLELLEDLLEIK